MLPLIQLLTLSALAPLHDCGVPAGPLAHWSRSADGFESVNVAVAVSVPWLAVTSYCATKLGGRLKVSTTVPSLAEVTSTSCFHVWPSVSLTTMWTAALGSQLAPVSVTVEPG